LSARQGGGGGEIGAPIGQIGARPIGKDQQFQMNLQTQVIPVKQRAHAREGDRKSRPIRPICRSRCSATLITQRCQTGIFAIFSPPVLAIGGDLGVRINPPDGGPRVSNPAPSSGESGAGREVQAVFNREAPGR
jgi:hypothetical protein